MPLLSYSQNRLKNWKPNQNGYNRLTIIPREKTTITESSKTRQRVGVIFLAGARRRKSFCSRKKRVQQFNNVFELLGPTSLKVLKLLGAGNTATQAAQVIGCVKSNITYWKNKLLRMGLLKLQTCDVFKIYSLTTYGSKVLARSERNVVPVETVVLEDYAVKFLIVEHEKGRIDWRKLGEPKNWEMLGVRVGGVRVVKTSRHVIIHPGRLKGWDTKELVFDAGGIVERVKNVLESRFGMVLSNVGFPLHKPIFRFYPKVAKELVKSGTIIVEGVGSVDESPPEREPHIEFEEKNARDYLLMPGAVRRLEEKVDALNDNVSKLVDSMEKFVDTFKKLIEPQGPAAPNNLRKEDVDYVV